MVGTLPVTSLAAGVEMKVVSERLGHSQISVTADLYTHVSRGLGRDAADRIAGALRAAGETLPGAFLAQTSKEVSLAMRKSPQVAIKKSSLVAK